MPKVIDTSYNQDLSSPNFYSEAQRKEYVNKRIEDVIFEKQVPPLPTRQQELNYIDNLETEFRNQPWLRRRYRKLQAGPLRKPYERSKILMKEYRFNYITNFAIGALLSSPLAIWWGRNNRRTAGGIPVVYYAKNYHNFPNVNPDHVSRWRFRLGYFGVMFLVGVVFAEKMTVRPFDDEYFTKPDMKPDTPMVEDTPEEARAKEQYYAKHYGYAQSQKTRRIFKNSAMYRLFRPNQADYEIRYGTETNNPYNSYNAAKNAYPSNSRMHEQHW